MIASASSGDDAYRRIGLVPLVQAETATATPTVLVGPDDLSGALNNKIAVVGGTTWHYSDTSGSIIFQTPTLRLTAAAPDALEISTTRTRYRSTSYGRVSFGGSPTMTTLFLIGDSGATAERVNLVSGILNSTDPAFDTSRLVQSKFVEAAAAAENEWFEDGVESAFSRALSTLLFSHSYATVAAAQTFLASPTSNTEIAVETAQWLGSVEHPASHYYRRAVLEKLLEATSTRIRHGAAAGLAAMNDAAALSAVKRARDREDNRRLHVYLELVVKQLERTRACRSS